MRLHLLYKQISVTVNIFDKNGVTVERKIVFQ